MEYYFKCKCCYCNATWDVKGGNTFHFSLIDVCPECGKFTINPIQEKIIMEAI